ncbi:unnamed protein product [Dibothriocephalus latus]|uniref:Fibronectin type-III domain-containing protein n=1 Tax=Dibothriocephalus latus TaxID=60516 RepID=A0A3P7LRX9_DIBLA|nr:unnamed protein product [Dibothriocephalus latus]
MEELNRIVCAYFAEVSTTATTETTASTTEATATVPTVGNLNALPLNDTAIRVSWTKPRPENEFKDEYYVTISIKGYKRKIVTSYTSIIVDNMDLSKMNNITVQAVWANGTVVSKGVSTSVQMPSTEVSTTATTKTTKSTTEATTTGKLKCPSDPIAN